MRKLIVSMNVTLDGYLSGPDCELDWHFACWTSEMAEALSEQLQNVDTIILGRTTYLAMARYWPAKALDRTAAPQDLLFIQMMNGYRKIVFSKTLTSATWQNATIKKELATEIKNLKKQSGKDLIVYGSAQLVAALIKLNVVDEYQLWVHPVVLGQGKRLFKNVPYQPQLALLNTRVFASGVVLLSYRVFSLTNPTKNTKFNNSYEKETTN